MSDETNSRIAIVAHIASGYFTGNNVPHDTVPRVISTIAETITELQARAADGADAPPPAIDPTRSVFETYIVCLECGRKCDLLPIHLRTHRLTADAYRRKWKLPPNYPMVSPAYSDLRSKLAIAQGLGKRPQQQRGRKKK